MGGAGSRGHLYGFVAVALSAQATDKGVNKKTTAALYSRSPIRRKDI
jgi:endonuclease III